MMMRVASLNTDTNVPWTSASVAGSTFAVPSSMHYRKNQKQVKQKQPKLLIRTTIFAPIRIALASAMSCLWPAEKFDPRSSIDACNPPGNAAMTFLM